MRSSHLVIIIIAAILVSFAVTPAEAGRTDNPPPLPGWTHPTRLQDDTPQRHGILLPGAAIVRSSPVIAEIDGNAGNGKEVAVGGSDGVLYAYRSDGTQLWSLNVLPAGCTARDGDFKLNSGPAVGTIFGDGIPYVVVGYGTITSSNCDGGVAAVRGTNGQLAWRFSTREWQDTQNYDEESNYGVTSSPALADTDGDGKLEIGFGGYDRNVYLLDADGKVRWYYHAADTVWSSPAFVNVTGDARLELVIGTDIAGRRPGGYVYAFDTQARNPVRIDYNEGFIWQTYFDQAIYSSPVIADVLDSNAGAEVLVGSSCYWPENTTNKNGKWVKILRPSDGTVLQTLNAPTCLPSSPAVGDLDDDGKLEVVATVQGATQVGGDGKSRTVAWKPTNPNPIWSVVPTDANGGNNDPFGADLQSPIIADVDGNGSLEVLVPNFWSVIVLNGRDGRQLTCPNDASCGNQTALFGWATVKSTPAVGDINGDGVLDVVIGGAHVWYNNAKGGVLYAWTNLAGLINSPQGTQPAYSAPWPMFRGNANHTGVLTTPSLRASSARLGFLVERAASATSSVITLTNPASAPLAWNAASNQPWLTVTPASGTASSATPGTLTITANPAGLAIGRYEGTVTVTSAAGTQAINVALTVAEQVYRSYLPLSTR